jgi:hypothetical protein
MRYPASEKAEIIALVEQSHLPAKRTLDKLGIPAPHFIGGTIASARAALRPWQITALDRIGFGIVSRMTSAARSSTWRWNFRNCRHESWPCGSPTRESTLSRRVRSIDC